MAATAVRYLRAAGAPAARATRGARNTHPGSGRPGTDRPGTGTGAESGTLPKADLRAVREDERAPVDPAHFRRVLGGFASGVTVVTAPAAPDPGERTPARASSAAETGGTPGPAGFACQSFASLSLDPPLVSFMVGRTSTSWPRIARAGVFCVNVLAADQGELCRAFAVSGADKFAGVSHRPAPVTGSPLLAGVAAWIDCEIHAVHTGGDHLIVVGRVRALDAAEDAGDPLVFHRGRLGTFAPVDGRD
ncbi:NADH-FMN oxidoreductase RutF, flavin reductase (DIM6/NTAB) family [Streptomyces qinglanensis]|uniref:NADH-FMN oxidoreductase RutF, flavin reductase (DIM6/NTAB) family n=1 Tax=Streptomyces qinglanensis TaxID=943816 RepID=A0A1H9W0M4_9ACTN|nr:flavin reductase family protein [Streptomyces qinglanensis]SES27354.1 NADH-FMN oxidoreductase RutF, flavin reductase (DIM6/NTAB) family [Streptomyces qinglanensis]